MMVDLREAVIRLQNPEVNGWLVQLINAVDALEKLGVTVTVEQTPLLPLAQGNYQPAIKAWVRTGSLNKQSEQAE